MHACVCNELITMFFSGGKRRNQGERVINGVLPVTFLLFKYITCEIKMILKIELCHILPFLISNDFGSTQSICLFIF